MALLEQISTSMIRSLAGATGPPSPTERINVAVAADKLAQSFADSFTRVSGAAAAFSRTQSSLTSLLGISEELFKLADRSADISTPSANRSQLNVRYQKLIRDFNSILNNAETGGFDLLDKGDLARVLENAGVDPRGATKLSNSFRAISRLDSTVGLSKVSVDDVLLTGDALPAGEVELGFAVTDPLNTSITTRADALVASEAIGKLVQDIKSDLQKVEGVVGELNAARRFAVAGVEASGIIGSLGRALESPETFVKELTAKIRTLNTSPSISAHSDIDRTLAKELLSPN